MRHLAIFHELGGKAAIVVGGVVAARRAEHLIKAGARVTTFAPALSDDFRELHRARTATCFRSVASPLGAENHDVLGGELQVRWNLRRPGARVFTGRKRRDLDHSARFQSVDAEAGIGGRHG